MTSFTTSIMRILIISSIVFLILITRREAFDFDSNPSSDEIQILQERRHLLHNDCFNQKSNGDLYNKLYQRLYRDLYEDLHEELVKRFPQEPVPFTTKPPLHNPRPTFGTPRPRPLPHPRPTRRPRPTYPPRPTPRPPPRPRPTYRPTQSQMPNEIPDTTPRLTTRPPLFNNDAIAVPPDDVLTPSGPIWQEYTDRSSFFRGPTRLWREHMNESPFRDAQEDKN